MNINSLLTTHGKPITAGFMVVFGTLVLAHGYLPEIVPAILTVVILGTGVALGYVANSRGPVAYFLLALVAQLICGFLVYLFTNKNLFNSMATGGVLAILAYIYALSTKSDVNEQ